ncbi:eukaryotic translation initiation factor NCBP [Alnus glutinosa]|uniref:eukaryotic translation initiation factor NCBP n=1 Tax=Alnus glutinosa TaxID=3517 RepID=UPI002D787EFF|nr:eukaryotic translation initiation factor NCBP [Alnus glutinosa]
MESVAEKKEIENNNNSNGDNAQPILDSSSSSPLSATADYTNAYNNNNKEARDFRERQAHDLKAGLHPLKYKFVFWYTRRNPGVRTQTSYEDNIKKIVDFSTVEGFWVCYCHLARPSSLPSPTDLHIFKEGIRPLWEDSANCNGGKWIIRFKKVVSGRYWEDLILALVGDQLDYGDNICGAVLSIRFNEDILSVWNRNASDNQAVMALRDAIKRHLKLPHSYVMEYKPHDASLRDNSSYRNTWLRG